MAEINLPDFDKEYLKKLYDDAKAKWEEAEYHEIKPEECDITYMRSMHRAQYAMQCGLSNVYKLRTYKIKEQLTLRKNSKNYSVLYRRDGKLVQTDLYSDGKKYFEFFQMLYEDNKRYCLPFCCFDGKTVPKHNISNIYVTVFDGDLVTEEYKIEGNSIIYERYTRTSDKNKVDYYCIHYLPYCDDVDGGGTKGLRDIYEGYITLGGERPEFHRTGGWSWYEEYYLPTYKK
jgi:hypothetical protein